jgi:hypothetical protein
LFTGSGGSIYGGEMRERFVRTMMEIMKINKELEFKNRHIY